MDGSMFYWIDVLESKSNVTLWIPLNFNFIIDMSIETKDNLILGYLLMDEKL